MDSRSERFISPSMKMADLINSEPDLLSVVSHCGIALGFGEDSVEECCARQGKDPFTFLTICRIFLFDKPSEVDCGKIRIDDVTDYLRGCHDSYKEIWLPQLEKEIAALEKEQHQLEEALCSGTLSVEELTEKSKRLPLLKDELDEKSMRWLELSEIEK